MRATTVAGLLTLAGCASALPAAERAPLRFEPHVLRGFDGVERPAEIGRLSVPARRAAARRPDRLPDGGPGIPASVMGQVPVYAQLFERLGWVADVILLDQRGTGLSGPLLECPPREKPLGPDAFLSQAGALDANTPPAQAEEVRFGLSNAAHLVVRLSGHEMLPIPDVPQAITDFFAGPGRPDEGDPGPAARVPGHRGRGQPPLRAARVLSGCRPLSCASSPARGRTTRRARRPTGSQAA